MKHAVVFIDHKEARLYFPDGTSEPEGRVLLDHGHAPKDGHRQPLDRHAVTSLCERLKNAEEILIVGPGSAKNELKSWLQEHHAETDARVVGVVAVDHPTPGELKKLALATFRRIDAWL